MKNLWIRLRTWYWYHIKYRKFSHVQRTFLCTFEQGIYARREVDSLVYDLLRLNIERAKCLFTDDFEKLAVMESIIKELGTEYDDATNDFDNKDKLIWGKMFTDFMRDHDDATVAKVWGAPVEQIVKFRAAVKLAPSKK